MPADTCSKDTEDILELGEFIFEGGGIFYMALGRFGWDPGFLLLRSMGRLGEIDYGLRLRLGNFSLLDDLDLVSRRLRLRYRFRIHEVHNRPRCNFL